MSIDNTNFFSYIYSTWITKCLWKAYRSGISLSNIPAISPLDSCACNIRKFENLWNEELRQRGPTSASLFLVAWKFIRLRVVISCILNASSQIVGFLLYTLLLRKLLEYSENPERYILNGIHWIIYIVVFDVVQMILYTWSDIMNQRTALRLKSACLSLLFKKVLHSNNISHKNTNELMNMLLNDGRKIYDAVNFGTCIVNGPVVTLCAIIYISIWLKPLALMGLIAFLLFYLVQNWFAHLINYCTRMANEFTRSRIQKTIELINYIQLVKINEWEDYFIKNITDIRNRESQWLLKSTYFSSLDSSMTYSIPFIAIIITFLMHSLTSSYFTISEAFPICVVLIVQVHGCFVSTRSSLSRIRDVVLTFNRMKNGLLLEDTNSNISKPFEASQAVAIVNASFAYDINKKAKYDPEIAQDIHFRFDNTKENIIASEEKEQLTTSIVEPKRVEILSNITFKARKGQLIGVYGPAKSGKSSLLLAALGQIKLISGQLMRQGSCAYAGQKPWLTDATLRENILFEAAYDPKRYYEVQVVCKLKPEVKSLPLGDETQLGDGGIEISESFKQKIALARAFYADRDIYFFDNPLSCMEDAIAEEIFQDLIMRALAEKTIIFVTHELKYINQCDYMYIMRDGKIAEHGRHKELMRLGKEYASIVKSAITDAEGDYSYESYEFEGSSSSNLNHSGEDSNIDTSNSVFQNENEAGSEKIMAITYYNYLKSYGGLSMLVPIVLTYIAFTAIGVISFLRLVWWIEAVNGVDIVNSVQSYKNWYGSCFFLVVFGCLLQSFVMQYIANKIADKFHNDLLHKLMYASVNLIDIATSKIIKNVFLYDLNNVSLSLPPKLDSTLLYIILVFFNFFILVNTIPWFTNYVVFMSIFFFIVAKIYRAAEVNLKRLENTQRLPNYKFLLNSLRGLTVIRTFKKENDILSKFQNILDESSACIFFRGIAQKWFSARLQILATTCLFVAAYFTVVLKENVSPGIVGLTFIYVIQMPRIIQISMKHFSETEPYFLSVQRIWNYLQTLISEDNNKKVTIIPDSKWPTSGTIRFDKAQLRFNHNMHLALDNISFTVANAEKIGILSKTESCRSSLVATMYRLYELSSGSIYIDSIDISQIDIKLLRNQVSYIPENPIFYGTIRFFLDPKKRHTDVEIWKALDKVHLKDKISSIASQLHYLIDGKIFSIYEKQLLFLAKAFLQHNKILLVEENTASDPEATALVRQVIDKEFSSCTVFIIAHRLHSVLSCNRVLVMDNGRILEFDSPSTLMDKQDSFLRKMWRDAETDERI